ncbi:MAG: ribonuclease P protein component [candidate division WOR-3 bacterium]
MFDDQTTMAGLESLTAHPVDRMERGRPRPETLVRKSDIEGVLVHGHRVRRGCLALHVLDRGLGNAAGRRMMVLPIGKFRSNVIRNRVRRRLRELYRQNQNHLPDGCDCVLRGDERVATMGYRQLGQQLVALMNEVVGAR